MTIAIDENISPIQKLKVLVIAYQMFYGLNTIDEAMTYIRKDLAMFKSRLAQKIEFES